MHRSVLLNEVIDSLNLSGKPAEETIVVDATFGGGGHSLEICKKYPGAKIIALDADKSAWKRAEGNFKNLGCEVRFVNANFRDLAGVLKKEGIAQVDGIIFDLGLSSDQLENSGRGFSFMKDEPLLMTMKANPRLGDLTARDIVNSWSEQSLADIIYGYGEERYSRRIAKGIVEARRKAEIQTTGDLVKVISEAVPAVHRRGRIPKKLHAATKTFQALRIAVNDELNTLEMGLEKGFEALKVGGRMAVISFHSLEDRIVKRFYKAKEGAGEARIVNKKLILPSKEEIKSNPRSRSAKLRILSRR